MLNCVHTNKYAKMQCTLRMLRTVQILSVQHWPLDTFNERRIGEAAEALC